jgi:hypothetical protein
MPRSDSRSIARSELSVERAAPASVFGVDDSPLVGVVGAVVVAPRWARSRMIAGSPRFVFQGFLHRLLLTIENVAAVLEAAARASDSRLSRTKQTLVERNEEIIQLSGWRDFPPV